VSRRRVTDSPEEFQIGILLLKFFKKIVLQRSYRRFFSLVSLFFSRFFVITLLQMVVKTSGRMSTNSLCWGNRKLYILVCIRNSCRIKVYDTVLFDWLNSHINWSQWYNPWSQDMKTHPESVPGFYLDSRLGSSDLVGSAFLPHLDSSIADSFAYWHVWAIGYAFSTSFHSSPQMTMPVWRIYLSFYVCSWTYLTSAVPVQKPIQFYTKILEYVWRPQCSGVITPSSYRHPGMFAW